MAKKTTKLLAIIIITWLIATVTGYTNPVKKTIKVDGLEREYMVYTPSHPFRDKADGILICLHQFERNMNDFFDELNVSTIADSLNMVIIAPQALPEQNQQIINDIAMISSLTDFGISLTSVWGCGFRIRASILILGTSLLDAELNKDINDVNFIDRMLDEVISDYSLPDDNVFVLGLSLGGFMAYQYALQKGERLSGVISIAGSMGLNIKGMDKGVKLPVCDFHSVTDEVVPYIGNLLVQNLALVSLAKPKADVINYWTQLNATGEPYSEQIRYYPSTNGITVEKITYPDPVNEVIHYKINGASHSYFFQKEAGDCMDHVEEIARFIQSHSAISTSNTQILTQQKPVFYPNPVSDRVYFNVNNGVISIYDLAGRKVFSQSFTTGQADLSFLKPGMYLVEIKSGNTVQVDKLIKK